MIKPQSTLQNAEFENREMNTGLGRADLILLVHFVILPLDLSSALEAVLNLRRQVHAVENFAFKVVQRHSHHLTVAINFNRTKELKTFCRR